MRIAAVGTLVAVVVILAVLLVGGGGGYSYRLLFQNAGQLVTDNQVLVGGHPVGSVDSITLTSDNLAQVDISSDQQLHEGTTAEIRATGLAGVANHYVSVSPGPNSNPALDSGATIGLASTTASVDFDQLFNTFTPAVRRGLSEFIQGNAGIYAGVGPQANATYKYFSPALSQTQQTFGELSSDQASLQRFIVSSGSVMTAIAQRGQQLSSAVGNANTAFGAIASQNRALSRSLQALPPTLRQSNTTFVNLRAALDDIDPLVNTAKPATKHLAPFLRQLRPVISRSVPFFKNLRLTVLRPGAANDAGALVRSLPKVERKASKAFPNAERALSDFQPTASFARPYAPEMLNALGKLGQITGYYDADGHYARALASDLNLFNWNSGSGVLDPIPPSQQYDAFGSNPVTRRCPGAATQSAADNSNPFVGPTWSSSGLTSADCNPSDLPPGP